MTGHTGRRQVCRDYVSRLVVRRHGGVFLKAVSFWFSAIFSFLDDQCSHEVGGSGEAALCSGRIAGVR